MDDLILENNVKFMHPFLPYYEDKRLKTRLYEEFSEYGLSKEEIKNVVDVVRTEDKRFKADIIRKADEIISETEKSGGRAIVLAGRPYHLDPEINHGIAH